MHIVETYFALGVIVYYMCAIYVTAFKGYPKKSDVFILVCFFAILVAWPLFFLILRALYKEKIQ